MSVNGPTINISNAKHYNLCHETRLFLKKSTRNVNADLSFTKQATSLPTSSVHIVTYSTYSTWTHTERKLALHNVLARCMYAYDKYFLASTFH